MDLHIKAYHLNHWLMSLYVFKYLQCSVTLLSQGWNSYFGVYSDLNLIKGAHTEVSGVLALDIYTNVCTFSLWKN